MASTGPEDGEGQKAAELQGGSVGAETMMDPGAVEGGNWRVGHSTADAVGSLALVASNRQEQGCGEPGTIEPNLLASRRSVQGRA